MSVWLCFRRPSSAFAEPAVTGGRCRRRRSPVCCNRAGQRGGCSGCRDRAGSAHGCGCARQSGARISAVSGSQLKNFHQTTWRARDLLAQSNCCTWHACMAHQWPCPLRECYDAVQAPGVVTERASAPRSNRGGSRLRMATGGHAAAPAPPDAGPSIKISGTARQRVAGPKVPLSCPPPLLISLAEETHSHEHFYLAVHVHSRKPPFASL